MTNLVNAPTLPRQISTPLWIAASGLMGFILILAIWAVYAPIVTTIRVPGSFASARSSYDIQHPFGGRIEKVFVSLHQKVAKNDPLFLLDVSTARKTLREIQIQIDSLNTENTLIGRMLDNKPLENPAKTAIELQYKAAYDALQSKIAVKELESSAASGRVVMVQKGIALLKQRQKILQARSVKNHDLVARGILAPKQDEALTDTILALGSQLTDKQAQRIIQQATAIKSISGIDTLKDDYRLSLAKKLVANKARLPELRKQAVRLQAEIDNAMIRSPVAGKVISLKYTTAQMYAGKGQTLLTLAQELQHPGIHMQIPTTLIDQVHTGMTGTLKIPALPQRQMPKIRLRISSIAPEATKTRDGKVEYYLALAKINQNDLDLAHNRMGEAFHLATDMPVVVTLEGRETTMSRYLFGAYFNVFADALQE